MPDTNSQASDFTATVDWGDGNSEQVQVTGGNGSFAVPDDHVYTAPGSFTVTVSITDSTGGNADASAQATAAVADSLGASGGGLTGGFVEPAIVNQSASLTLAALESTDLTPSDFTVQIDWGDGSTPSPITLGAAQNGMYLIGGAHTYAADGNDTATITITDSFGTTLTTTSTVNVGDLYAGIPATLTLGSFTAPDPNTTYTATVAWGDGGSSAATVTETGGAVTIIGTHTYALAGAFQPTITVTPAGAAPITANAPPVQVVSAQITMYASNAEATTGNTLLATFTDANPADTAANFTASLIWGDGTTTNGTITGGNGLFSISDSRILTPGAVLAVQVLLAWNMNLICADQPDVEAAPVDGGQLTGPSIVPGNSIYFFAIPAAVDLTNSRAVSRTVSAGGSFKDPWYVRGVDVQFANTPATVVITYDKRVNGVLTRWTKIVTVVEIGDISVGLPFEPSSPNLTIANGRVTIQNGLRWNAYFYVQAPASNPSAVSAIRVGFIQHATIATASQYRWNADAMAGERHSNVDAYFQGRPLAGQTFLDATPGNVFYPAPLGDTFTANNGPEQWTSIFGRDFPAIQNSPISAAGWFLFNYNDVVDFQLDVAATISGDPTSYWAEAGVRWWSNLSYAFNGRAANGSPTYAPVSLGLTPAGVWLASNNWVTVNQPKQEVVTAVVAIQALNQLQWRPLGS